MMKALRIEPADNVAVVAQDTRKGDVLRHAGGEVTALEDITEELCRQYVAAFRDGRDA